MDISEVLTFDAGLRHLSQVQSFAKRRQSRMRNYGRLLSVFRQKERIIGCRAAADQETRETCAPYILMTTYSHEETLAIMRGQKHIILLILASLVLVAVIFRNQASPNQMLSLVIATATLVY